MATVPLLARYYLKVRPWKQNRKHRKKLKQWKDADAFVLSFPKSGRTWHRVMLGTYLARKSASADNQAMNLAFLCKQLGLPSIVYSHNGASFNDARPSRHPYVADPDLWRGKRVLLLVRDPRDLLVSAYFHARHRDKIWFLSLSEFVRNDWTGIDKILAAYSRWFDSSHVAASFDVLAYEDMHANPAEAVRRTLNFAGIPEPDEALVAHAVEFASFENMRRLEESDFFKSVGMRTTGSSLDGRKVRAGRIGGFREHLSSDDLAFIDAAIVKLGGPIADRYGRASSPNPVEKVA